MNRGAAPRIAFVSTMAGSPWGGSEVLWHGTALCLQRSGLDVQASVYDWSREHPAVREMEHAGVAVQFRARHPSRLQRLARRLRREDADWDVDARWLRGTGADLVVFSQGYPLDGLGWMTTSRRLGMRYATIVQAAGEWCWPDDAMRLRMLEAYTHSRPTCFVSKANLECVQSQLGMRMHDARIVCNPWHPSASEAVEWPEDDGITRIACVARLDPKSKGQDLLLRVLAQEKWRQRPLQLGLFGEGPCMASLRGMADTLGITHVVFHGRSDDIASIWRRHHALVLPSRYEGMPLAILEAMRCARPVITTDVAGNAAHVRDEWNGFVAAAPTVGHLDDALERAWSMRAEWKTMGVRARGDIVASVPPDPFRACATALLESIGHRLP